jgi:hypothetical protein
MEEEDPNIFPPFEAFYITSLLFCTESALSSASAVMDLLEENQNRKFEFPPRLTLDQLQNIANQGAAISRYFWPSDPKYAKRGSALRVALKVEDSSPLRERKLRNIVEHFDEYLDDFLKKCLAGQFIPDYFGPKPPDDRGPLMFFRAFFTNTGEFEILGQIFPLQPIVDEIQRIHKLLIECEVNGSRFPR